MAANDPAVRIMAARAGGQARWANADPEEILRTRRAAAAAINSPAGLARRIVKAWPTLTRAERAEVRAVLGTVLR